MKAHVRSEPSVQLQNPHQQLSEQGAQLLLSAQARAVLAAFRVPATLSAAANALGQPLNTVKYHLKRLVACGLLVALPERRYQVSAEQFFIPYDQLPDRWSQEYLALLHQPWTEQLDSALVQQAETVLRERHLWGVQVIYKNGEYCLEHAVQHADWNFTQQGAPALLDVFDGLSLNYQEAKQLQQDLLKLLSQYKKKGGAQPYLLRLTLVPAPIHNR